jgi:crotonobetainyl-CoA:carnitine CoA-transferase CaiB-like acyl-CoA transferase
MRKALEGVKIFDFTHVQSSPTCTPLLAWFGVDAVKVERAGEGDAMRGQLHDIPGADSLYFTKLNHNMRSIMLDTKKSKGKEVLERGKYLTVGNTIKLLYGATEVTRSPLLGEHTDEVLTQLGYSCETIAALRAERVI